MNHYLRQQIKFKLLPILLVGLMLLPVGPAGGAELQQGFTLPGGQSQGGSYSLSGAAGISGAGLSAAGSYTLRSGLVFPCRGVELSSTSINISEGGLADYYTLHLLTAPMVDVVINISGDPQLEISPASLTFTPANWSVAQAVYTAAADDLLSQGARDAVISHTASSADPAYDGITIGGVTAHINDNDSPGVSLLETEGSTTFTEGGSDSYTLVLNSQPVNDVTLSVYAAPGININPDNLTFTPLDWSIPQTVTISAPDDNTPQGSRNIAVNHSSTSTDPQYNTLVIPPVTAHILDNDSPGVNVIQSGGGTEVTEGGPADSYQINLSTIPADNVMVSVYASNELQLSKTSLVFTPANWSSFQNVEASAPDDSLTQGDRVVNISHTVSSSDPDYHGLAVAGVAVTIHDNDIPGLIINESNGNTVVAEGHSGDSFTLALKTCPSSNVTVNISGSNQITISPSTLLFTPANWNQPQAVTVTAVDDNLTQGDRMVNISYTVSSSDPDYHGLTAAGVAVTIHDNDIPGLIINESNGNTVVAEGGSGDSFTLALRTCPSSNVTVNISGSNQITISPSTLLFTPANWNQPQAVTVTAVDDNLVEGPHNAAITYTVQSNDLNYQSLTIPSLQVNITDNDKSSGGDENFDDDSANPYPSTPTPVNSTTGSADVAPQSGGSVNLGNDALLQIPAGALGGSSAVKLVITRVVPKPAAPPGYRIPGDVFRFTVGGAEHYKFAKPIRVNLSFDPNTVSPWETPGIYYFDESRGDWVSVTGAISGHTVTVIVDHFTNFAVMIKEQFKAFNDIKGHWAEESIKKMADRGAVKGYPDETFRPDTGISRAEFAAMLVKAWKLDAKPGKVFADTAGHWAKDSITTAAAHGVVCGYPDNMFGPDDPVTREQMALMIVKAARLAGSSGETAFTDNADISRWAQYSVAVAVKAGIMKGYPDNNFKPKNNATRAEAVTVILNAVTKGT